MLIPVYIRKTLGPLGRIKRSKFNSRDGTENRNDSYSPIGLNLLDSKAAVVAREGGIGPEGVGIGPEGVGKAKPVSVRLSPCR